MRSRALLAVVVSILVAGISYEVQAGTVSVGVIDGPTEPVEGNTIVNFTAQLTNLDVGETHGAVWHWGDGYTSAGDVQEANGSGSVTGTHVYWWPGVYTVTLGVTNQAGASGESVFQYVVVYDPEGGFVTGGGWIQSPELAYTPDPTATGKANFGFVSKYKKGASVPSGETEFQFHAGDLNFHSTEYQWLVIAGSHAKFKGFGTINGAGDYGFMLTATDGEVNGGGGVDKFRIKIWATDDEGNEIVVYDNQMGDSDDGDATDAIEGGSIVIHVPKLKDDFVPT